MELFAAQGVEATSLRAIAKHAKVDPALIRHFFSDKTRLFAEVMADRSEVRPTLMRAITGPTAGTGHRLATAYLQLWEDPETGRLLQVLARSASSSPRAAEYLVDTLTARALDPSADPVMARLDRPGLELAASHLLGVAWTRHVLALPTMTAPSIEELVERLGPVLQQHLFPAASRPRDSESTIVETDPQETL